MTFSLYSVTKSTSSLNSGFSSDNFFTFSFSLNSYEYKDRLVITSMAQSKLDIKVF